MSLDHLLTALERDAAAQADAMLAEARATAAAIARDADERVARRRSEALGAKTALLGESAETALAEARRAGRRRVLEARQRLLERVFAAALTLLPEAVAGAAYRAALPHHIADALGALGDESAVIRCPDALAPIVRAATADRKQLPVQSDAATRPGIVAVTTDGLIEVDQTLEGRLERQRPRLALEVLARLDTCL